MIRLGGPFNAGRPTPRIDDREAEHASPMEAEGTARGDDGADDKCYRLISIDAADAPEGCTGEDWFIYRITQDGNGITGYRRGSLERVSADVLSIVTSLNGRRNWTKNKPSSGRQRRATAAARRAAR